MEGKSLNITKDKFRRLKKIIPGTFVENKMGCEKPKAALGDDIEFKKNYQLKTHFTLQIRDSELEFKAV